MSKGQATKGSTNVPVRPPTLWGIHAGKTGDADSLFLDRDVIALGWVEMGDMSSLPPDREAFKARLIEVRPARQKGYYPVSAGQVFRFVHEAKPGDLVLYPSKRDRQVHIGEIAGAYKYNPKPLPGYPQHRAVKWLKAFPRTKFSQGALYEIGSAMSFFQVKNYADEFLAALAGQETARLAKQDESVSYVAEEIEQNTRDFVLKTLAQELKGHALGEFVAHLLSAMGYRTRLSPEGPDGGIDIIAHKDELGFEPPIIKVQVKSTESAVGDPIVSQLYGTEQDKHLRPQRKNCAKLRRRCPTEYQVVHQGKDSLSRHLTFRLRPPPNEFVLALRGDPTFR